MRIFADDPLKDAADKIGNAIAGTGKAGAQRRADPWRRVMKTKPSK